MGADVNLPRIKWPGHPEDGMWRESIDADGHTGAVAVPIRRVTGGAYSVDVDENVSPAQIILRYHTEEQPGKDGMSYTCGGIAVSLSDLSVRYYRHRCGVGEEIGSDELPAPMRVSLTR